jgi:glycosyltransferase involved in cell wall biosynthesis
MAALNIILFYAKNRLMNRIKLGIIFVRDCIKNFFAPEPLVLITEAVNWSISDDCQNIKNHLKSVLDVRIAITPRGCRNKIVHFASENMLIGRKGLKYKSKRNKIVLTWFHISQNDEYRIKNIPLLNMHVDMVHTACNITKEKLIKNGLDEKKVAVIPLGVDLKIFFPASRDEKAKLRKKLDLPEDKILIGSFQKDGNGWGEGREPKLIKGPDIFCDVVERLNQKYPIHVVLTGPARGYVKKRLDTAGIPYTHNYVEHYSDTAEYFRTLDLYLVGSREEGGPKAILEAMASGVPLVSTKVGMVPDVLQDGTNGFVTEVEDVDTLFGKTSKLLEDEALRDFIVANALATVKNYEISYTVKQYYDKIYKDLLH